MVAATVTDTISTAVFLITTTTMAAAAVAGSGEQLVIRSHSRELVRLPHRSSFAVFLVPLDPLRYVGKYATRSTTIINDPRYSAPSALILAFFRIGMGQSNRRRLQRRLARRRLPWGRRRLDTGVLGRQSSHRDDDVAPLPLVTFVLAETSTVYVTNI